MKAMIFAAGYGQRLSPLTDDLPKALVPVAGRPMIEYPLLLLRHYGIREIILNLHHLGEKIEAHLGDGRKLGLKISYSREKELLDTGGGLLEARSFFDDGAFIVINSDVMIDLSLAELIAAHQKRRAVATLVLRPDPQAKLFGLIETSDDLRIRRFLGYEAPQLGRSGPLTPLMFTGVQILEPELFGYMESASAELPRKFGITRLTYPKMLTGGAALFGHLFHGFWQDLGTAERIREAEEKLRSGAVKLHYLQADRDRDV